MEKEDIYVEEKLRLLSSSNVFSEHHLLSLHRCIMNFVLKKINRTKDKNNILDFNRETNKVMMFDDKGDRVLYLCSGSPTEVPCVLLPSY